MKEKIVEKLNSIGIINASQLKEKDINQWRLLKINEVMTKYSSDSKKLEEEKIKINQAYQYLEVYSKNELVNFLLKDEFKENNDKRMQETKDNISAYELYKEGDECLSKDVIKSINLFTKAINAYDFKYLQDSDRANIFSQRGMARWYSGNFKDGLADLNEAIKIEPNHIFISNRACIYFEEKYWGLAINDFSRAIALEKDAEYYFKRGLANYNLKKYNDALRDYKFALELEPDNKEFNISKEKAIEKLSEIKDKSQQDQMKKDNYGKNKTSKSNNFIYSQTSPNSSSHDLDNWSGCGMFLYFAFSILFLFSMPGLGIILIVFGIILFKKN